MKVRHGLEEKTIKALREEEKGKKKKAQNQMSSNNSDHSVTTVNPGLSRNPDAYIIV
jgi:hypothetical protein